MKELGRIIRFQNTHQSEDFQTTNVEDFKDVPFHIRRTYWTYDIPAGAARGGHAHRECLEVIIAASGSFTVTLDDGRPEAILSSQPPRPGTTRQHRHLANAGKLLSRFGLSGPGFGIVRRS